MTPQKRKRSNKKTSSGKSNDGTTKRDKRTERGRSVLKLATKALRDEDPLKLEWDSELNLPTGDWAAKFSSWIGITVRGHVSCTVKKWDDVDQPTRQDMLENITGAFTVSEEREEWCLSKAGELWRKWKSKLVCEWLYDEETGAIRKTPPTLWKQIKQDEWNSFVASHTTDAFKAISEKNKKNAAQRQALYHGSRGGYRGIETKVKEDFAKKGCPMEKVDRYLVWLRAHTSEHGDMTDYVKEVEKKIEAIKKDVEAGVFVPKGRDDILAKALGKAEHPGRVRGVPSGIGIKEYFGKAPKNPTPTQLKERISTLEEQLKETQMMILKFWQTGERPSEEVLARLMDTMTKSTQGQGSQSHAREELQAGKAPREELEEKSGEESPEHEPSYEEKSAGPENEEPMSDEVFRTPVATIPNFSVSTLEGWKICVLSLPGNPKKKVGSGLVYMSHDGEFVSIHGATLRSGFKKVTIKKVYGGFENALLPVPVGDLEILSDAKGSFVQWPQSNIHTPNEKNTREDQTPESTKFTLPKTKPLDSTSANFLGVKVSPQFRQKWRTKSLKTLIIEARVLKTSATMISVDIEEHILHQRQKCMFSYEDLIHWCDEAEISASHIALFIRYLTELTKSMQCTNSYGFLCPTTLSKFASFENEENRSDYIVTAMTCTACEGNRKLVFAPYFEGNHWMLAAINRKDSVVYWCDPAGTLEPRKFLKDTINMAITKLNSMDPLFGCHLEKQLEWKIIKCPTQPFGTVLCGYYVCRYMLEIIRGRYINIIPNFMIKAPKTYSAEQTDEVRDIWATYALDFKAQTFDGNV